jgi:hypothetical protein
MLDQSGLRSAFRAAALVTELTVLTGLGLLAGVWWDGKLSSDPWLSLLGTASGFAAGITRVFLGLGEQDPSDEHRDPDP